MSQEGAPVPARRPKGTGPRGPRPEGSGPKRAPALSGDSLEEGAPDVGGAEAEADPECGSAADEEGLRWAALLAAFINDMQIPPDGTAGELLSPGGD
ncbi:hypothetical protein ACFYUH_32950 [Streptomyces fimicarius]|uniref:hypothetical protein n=1 Tax=Streptomyces griseus TaxID=1911 RepID=UPI00367BEA82